MNWQRERERERERDRERERERQTDRQTERVNASSSWSDFPDLPELLNTVH